MQLVMVLPTKDSPGFLRRSKQASSFAARLKAQETDPQVFDDMIEFLLQFVKEPEDRDAAREALWNASQVEFEKALTAIGGGDSTVNPQTAKPSTSSIS